MIFFGFADRDNITQGQGYNRTIRHIESNIVFIGARRAAEGNVVVRKTQWSVQKISTKS